MKSYSDDGLRKHIVDLTGSLRYASYWQSARNLLQKNGVDAQRCLLLDCDQGGSLLMRPSGELVVFDIYGNGADWCPVDFLEVEDCWREISIGLAIVESHSVSEFDTEVREFYRCK